jgi:hypothetical protein
MSRYTEVLAMFVGLGWYVFVVYWCWFHHLTALAARYGVAERRRRAEWRYLVVVLLVAAPVVGTIFGAMNLWDRAHRLVMVLLLVCAVAPASLWWIRRLPDLRALGYGRQR